MAKLPVGGVRAQGRLVSCARHAASAYKKGSQIEVFYSFTQTKFRAELGPTMGLTKYYLLAVSIASMVACIGMLIWAKRMRRDEDEPDVPSLEEALRRAT